MILKIWVDFEVFLEHVPGVSNYIVVLVLKPRVYIELRHIFVCIGACSYTYMAISYNSIKENLTRRWWPVSMSKFSSLKWLISNKFKPRYILHHVISYFYTSWFRLVWSFVIYINTKLIDFSSLILSFIIKYLILKPVLTTFHPFNEIC